jgi:copper chaperone NosL
MRRRLLVRLAAIVAVALLVAAGPAAADRVKVPAPGQTSICPVCGMFVAKYPQWVAVVVYRDGHAHFFDGAKDLFKYLANLARYAPGHRAENIATIAVTDYYGVEPIDAKSALYVIGSDVLGPMGHELVPLASRSDAEEFFKDHSGSRIVAFDDVTPDLIAALDRSRGR